MAACKKLSHPYPSYGHSGQVESRDSELQKTAARFLWGRSSDGGSQTAKPLSDLDALNQSSRRPAKASLELARLTPGSNVGTRGPGISRPYAHHPKRWSAFRFLHTEGSYLVTCFRLPITEDNHLYSISYCKNSLAFSGRLGILQSVSCSSIRARWQNRRQSWQPVAKRTFALAGKRSRG